MEDVKKSKEGIDGCKESKLQCVTAYLKKLKSSARKLYYKTDRVLIGTLLLLLIGYILMHDLIGGQGGSTLFKFNYWDSYSLQAEMWLRGQIALDKNYDYLEIAIYNGNYYVSFPPFPAVLMLPWVMIFGMGKVPNNLVMIMYIMITITVLYKCVKKFNVNKPMFWALAIVIGSNMTWMSTMGGVWFQAQLVNMMLCSFTLYCMLKDKRTLAYLFLALAVGCRPFSALYFPAVFAWFYIKDRNAVIAGKSINKKVKEIIDNSQQTEKVNKHSDKSDNDIITENEDKKCSVTSLIAKQWKGYLVTAIVAVIYMVYNYVRFDSVLEFGHNYLPEFTEAQDGQFNMSYLISNLKNLFGFENFKIYPDGTLEFVHFNGFLIFIANPVFIILLIYIIRNLIRNIIKREFSVVRICLLAGMILNIIALCIHKTLGGWQFGARYTVDLMVFALLYIMMSKNPNRDVKKICITKEWEIFIGIAAIMFNIYGTIYMYMNG